MWRTPALDAVVTIAGIDDRQRASRIDRSVELYASGEIAGASVDARLSTDRRAIPATLRMRGYRTDPDGRLLGPIGATYIAAGDVTSYPSPIVAGSVPGRGFAMTNRPVDMPDVFDRTSLRGELPQGWDAELYRNDQLLQFAQPRADGRYEFLDIPLLFGMNSLEVILYGPQGQVRRQRKMINVGMDNPPPGKLRYSLSFSQDNHDLVTVNRQAFFRDQGWRGSLAMETGIGLRTSLALQLHSVLIEDQRLTFVEGSVRRSVGPALVELSGALERHGGHAIRAQMIGAFGNTYLTAESIIARDIRTDRIDKNVTGLHSLALDHSFNFGQAVLPVHLDARYTTRSAGFNSLDIASRLSTRLRNVLVTGQLNWRKDISHHGPAPPDRMEGTLLANGRIGKVRLRGEARWEVSPTPGFDAATLIADWDHDDRQSWRAEFGYDRGMERGRAGLGYVRQFDRLALSATAEIGTDGSMAAGLNLAFSLGANPMGRGIRISSAKQAAFGHTAARVFRDSNGDGNYQPGEPLEAGVQMTAGRVPVDRATDRDGMAIIDGLQPFQPVLIGIDSSSLADPLVQPSSPGVMITPRPGIGNMIDIALVSAGEIDGTLVRDGSGPLEGVDLELIGERGNVQAVTRSEYDGFFLFESVPYGKYRLRIAELSASAAHLHGGILQDTMVGSAASSVHLGMIAARPLDQRMANSNTAE